MNTHNIMPTNALDALFSNRNKSYGAYQLRKNYNKRLSIAIAVTISSCLLFFITYQLQTAKQNKILPNDLVTEFTLINPVKDKPLVIPPPVKPKPVEQHQAATKFSIPKLVNEPVEVPPAQDDLTHIRIDVVSKQGDNNDKIAPPLEQNISAGESPIKIEDYTKEFHTVEKMAHFPGGLDGWMKYLYHNLRSEIPTDNGAPVGNYTVYISFLVDRQGNISEVKADNDPGYGIAAEAVRVIQRGPKWIPAEQNGNAVIYRQKQSVTFVVSEP